ncbi:hypothetical protein T492DRAFT_31866 [Pavlovales sp. CCMP2436]|nr:hypothetical protein T492DRAFT_31866 [Pavlovales sp. CCMP2436]
MVMARYSQAAGQHKATALARRAAARTAARAEGEAEPGALSELLERFDGLLGHAGGDEDEALASAGEASMAASFSARPGTPLAAVAVLRHARAALGHAVQMRALLCLHGLSAAGALSALHLRGVRYGRAHLLAANVLGSLCGWATAFPQLRRRLARSQMASSLFEPALASSLLLQALAHAATMAGALALGAREDAARVAAGLETAPAAPAPSERSVLGAPARPFAPSAVNSAVVCVELAQTLAITAVSVRLAHAPKATQRLLARAFRLADVALVVAASGLLPVLTALLQLQPASGGFRAALVGLIVADRAGAALCDQIVRALLGGVRK